MQSRHLLDEIRGGAPNGRPLYAYRLDEQDHRRIQQLLRDRLSAQGHVDRHTAALFCIYVAHWFQRHQDAGAWTWQPIKDALHIRQPDEHLRTWTTRGLQLLDRTLIVSDGARRCMMTLACEGGLPIKRLAGGSLRDYFDAIFEHFARLDRTGAEAVDTLVKDAETFGHHLAQTFRTPTVFRLSGMLAGGIWRLRQHLREEGDPVAILDRIDPDWRDTLPVVTDDDTARALLGDILEGAGKAVRRHLRLRVRTIATLDADAHYHLTRHLECPSVLSDEQLRAAFPDLPTETRARLLLGLLSHRGASAEAGTLRRHGDHWQYSTSRPHALDAVDVDDETQLELWSRATGSLFSHGIRGSGALGSLPWVFTENERTLTLVGTGSTSHPSPTLWVAITEDHQPLGAVSDTEHRLHGRRLVRIQGRITIQTPEGTVRIRASGDTDAGSVELAGPTLPSLRGQRPIWLGTPSLRRLGQPLELEAFIEGRWVSARDRFGNLRARARVGDDLVYQGRLYVVPPETEVEVKRVGRNGVPAIVAVRGVDAVEVRTPGVEVAQTPTGMELRSDAPPTTLELECTLPHGSIRATMPYPATSLHFQDAEGRRLERDTVHLKHLVGLTAVGVTPRPDTPVTLTLRVSSAHSSVTPQPVRRVLKQRYGAHSLQLLEVQRQAEQLLDMTDHLDSVIHLRLASDDPAFPANTTLFVQRHDWTLTPDHELGDVELDIDLPEEELERVHVEARPFHDISQRTPLVRLRSGRRDHPTWSFEPTSRPAGSYLITLEHDGWHRCRSVPMTATGPGTAPSTGLGAAMQHTRFSVRQQAIRETLAEMGQDGTHPDWSLLMDYVALLGDLPAATFDVLRELVKQPYAVARVALRAARLPDDGCARVLRGLDQLLFLWEAVPAAAWWSAFDELYDGVAAAAPEHALTAVRSSVHQLVDDLPGLELFFAHWCHHRGLDATMSSTAEFSLRPESERLFLEERDQAADTAVRTHQSHGSWWPRAPADLELPDARWRGRVPSFPPHLHSTLLAPTLLAVAAASDTALNARTTLFLEELQAFDPHLFNDLYLYSLGAVLGSEERPR